MGVAYKSEKQQKRQIKEANRSLFGRFAAWSINKAVGSAFEGLIKTLFGGTVIGRIICVIIASLVLGAITDLTIVSISTPSAPVLSGYLLWRSNFSTGIATAVVLGTIVGAGTGGFFGAIVGMLWGWLAGVITETVVTELVSERIARYLNPTLIWVTATVAGSLAGWVIGEIVKLTQRPPNIDRLQAKGNVRALIKALRYETDYEVCISAALAIMNISSSLKERGDTRAVEPLIIILNDRFRYERECENRKGNYYESRRLGRYGNTNVNDKPIQPPFDIEGRISQIATGILGTLNDKRAVEPLIDALISNDFVTVLNAVSSLGVLGDERAIQPLIALARSGRFYERPFSLMHQSIHEAIERLRRENR